MMMVVATLVMVAFFIAKLARGNVDKPGPDGCVGEPVASTVIVLDQSEVVSEQTTNEIVARALAYIQNRVSTNERVSVFKISDISRTALHPSFSRCKPRQDGNRLVEGTKGMKKGFERDFLQPLQAALSTPPTNGKESPIAQALIDVSLSHYLRGERSSLLVFSDLMEHTPSKFSLYPCTDSSSVIAHFRDSRKGAQERPKFTNTSVYLHVIPRMDLPRPSLQCRDKLWLWFFGDNEGSGAKAEFDYLPGA